MTTAKPYIVIVFKADGEITQSTRMKEPTYEEQVKAVGGYIQQVPHFSQYEGLRRGKAFANENGIQLNLPFNKNATEAWLKNLGKGPFIYEPLLVGDVIYYGKEK